SSLAWLLTASPGSSTPLPLRLIYFGLRVLVAPHAFLMPHRCIAVCRYLLILSLNLMASFYDWSLMLCGWLAGS
ncbi:hypothetical protein V8C86DRAFT_2570566, partial [Haematococcus lacustris]